MNENKEPMDTLNSRSKNKVDQLEHEKALLLRQIDELNHKLMESETFKSHFISNVSNEIMNPFASITGLSKAIMNLKGKELEKAPEMARLIFEESKFLDFQLTNIFAAAHLESGIIQPEMIKFKVRPFLDEVVAGFSYELKKQDVEVNIVPSGEMALSDTDYFKTDRDKLRLILINLLNNAIKFSGKGKKIEIQYALDQGQLSLTVVDEGVGMSKETLSRIFDRFERGNKSIHSLNPGNGLGLAVVEGLLYLLDGEIKVHSTEGKGSRFQLIIPEMKETALHEDEDGLFDDLEAETF